MTKLHSFAALHFEREKAELSQGVLEIIGIRRGAQCPLRIASPNDLQAIYQAQLNLHVCISACLFVCLLAGPVTQEFWIVDTIKEKERCLNEYLSPNQGQNL